MNNFYSFLEISKNASNREILMVYENKITKFYNLKKLTPEQVGEIKMLKMCLYVLTNSKLRKKYDGLLNKPTNTNSINNEPVAINEEPIEESNKSLDTLFKVDNSWMNGYKLDEKQSNDGLKKKNNTDNNLIGDRVFSLPGLNQRHGYSSDFEASLRKPSQGREDKTSSL